MRLITTENGKRRLLARLQAALDKYNEIVASNPEAAESGDNCVWHDNFAYEENQRQMHAAARRVRDLRELIGTILVVPIPSNLSKVRVGASVLIERESGAEERWIIAGYEDGDISAGRISYTAPIARALMGAEEGESVHFIHNGTKEWIDVLDVSPAEDA